MLTETSAAEVASRFGLGDRARLEGPVAQGKQGRVWRLSTERGTYAVKEPILEVAAVFWERDAAYQDTVRANGVPMPAVVRSAKGRVQEVVDATQVRVYAWVDVCGPDNTLDPATVGRTLAAIHRVVVPTSEPIDPWYAAPVGAAAWQDLVDRLSMARAPFAADLAGLLPVIDETERLIRPAAAVQMCHRDLWEDNLRGTPAGGVMVMDWEGFGPGVPSQELMVVLATFGAWWGVDEAARVRALLTAYQEAGGPARLTGPEDATMLMAQLAHILQEGCRRWLASDTDAERADHEAWVREYLDGPPTPAMVEAILAVAADL